MSPYRSMRAGSSSPGLKMSTTPPRTENVPGVLDDADRGVAGGRQSKAELLEVEVVVQADVHREAFEHVGRDRLPAPTRRTRQRPRLPLRSVGSAVATRTRCWITFRSGEAPL